MSFKKFIIEEFFVDKVVGPDAEKNLHKEFEDNYAHLENNHDNKSLIRNYSQDSTDINSTLIDKHNGGTLNSSDHFHLSKAQSLSNVIKNANPLHKDTTVYSSTGRWDVSASHKEGDIIHTPAFTSTSIFTHVPQEHYYSNIADTEKNPNRTINYLKINLPKGYKHGAYIGHMSKFPEEGEFLINRDRKWKLNKTSYHEDFLGNKVAVHELEPHEDDLQ
jgi:hypothetical protein